MLALAGAKVCQFDKIALDKDILRLDVAMENAFAVHKLDGTQYLKHVEFDFLEGEWIFFIF